MHRTAIILVIGLLWALGCSAIRTVPLEDLARTHGGAMANFFYPTAFGKAEAYLVRPKGRGPFPLMVLLHGHSWRTHGAEQILPAAEAFANDLCYVSLAVSLPGYGETEVSDGTDPEVTLRVVLDAISVVTKLDWIDAQRLYLYGFSRGGFFAAELVTRLPNLRGVVLHSGAYELNRLYRETPYSWLRRMLNPHEEADPKLYSVLPEVSKWRAPTLILHGSRDRLIPVLQATLLSDSLEAAHKPYQMVLFPESGHRLPMEEVREKTASFLRENAGSACSVSGS